MKKAFTLAETLITLGIIGGIAALTIPPLVTKFKNHVYYAQFMKAATSIENAFNNLYNSDKGYSRNTYLYDINPNWINDFFEYFNIAEYITDENKKQICAGYDKLPAGNSNNDRDPEFNSEWMCENDDVGVFLLGIRLMVL